MTTLRCIIPEDILVKHSKDSDLPKEIKNTSRETNRVSKEHRKIRTKALSLTRKTQALTPLSAALSSTPAIAVYNCKNLMSLPGIPAQLNEPIALHVHTQTTMILEFYQNVFGRNSLDNAGMTIVSSIHYGSNHMNAIWNGLQVLYGDGDGRLYTNFANGNDIICHELTHGVIQYTLQLDLTGETGGLNESISDCFSSMFRQWQANQDVDEADWLIGRDILGPENISRGYTCIRNLANPNDPHCLLRQPTKYSEIYTGMGPHESSGPPNLAFYLACMSVGGKSWENIGKIWYMAINRNPSPKMKMKEFADRTRYFASQNNSSVPGIANAINNAWNYVEL